MKHAISRLLKVVFRKYDFWRIYFLDLLASPPSAHQCSIAPINDLSIFNAPGLEDELRRANWHREGAIGFGAWRDGKLAGVCWLWPGPLLGDRNVGLQAPGCAELIQITVAGWCRRAGIGQALILHAAARLREMGYKQIYAQIWWTNTASMHTFQRCGWKQVAWFIEFCPRFLRRPLRFRLIRRPFSENPAVLKGWRNSRTDTQLIVTDDCEAMDWQIANQSLRWTISDITLTEYRFRALVSDVPITTLLGVADPPVPARNSSAARLAGAVIRGFPLRGKLNTFARVGPWLRYVPIRYTRFLVERKGTFEEYLERFSSKSRKNLRRSVRKFEEAASGQPCWREYRTVEDADRFHRAASAISEKTYQTRLFHEGISGDEDVRQKLREMAAHDQLRGYVLFLNAEPVAFALCERKGDVLLYKTIGYAPEHRDRSPGTVLLWFILTNLFTAADFRLLDFGEGEGFYKEFFSNLTLPCARIYYFHRRPTIFLVVAMHRCWNWMFEAIGRLPGMAGFVRSVRNMLRRHVSGDPQRAHAQPAR